MYEHLSRARRIDLSLLSDRPIGPSLSGGLEWSRDGELRLAIDFRISKNGNYIFFEKVGDPERRTWKIRFEYTDQNFGGQRRWFVCPDCKRRCRILYFDNRVLCRKCMGIAYLSKELPFRTGQIARAKRMRLRLCGTQSLHTPFPPKPKYMRWKTYRALERADVAAEMALASILGTMAVS